MTNSDARKVAIIGCGFVGSACAFALMESGLFSEIVLLDANTDRAEGEALDISHGLPFSKPMQIYAGTYDDISDASIIIITAGTGQKKAKPDLIWCTEMWTFTNQLFRKSQGETSKAYC